MFILWFFCILFLLCIFYQDMKDRAVFWFLFPVLAVILAAIRYIGVGSVLVSVIPGVINLGFLMIQLILLTVYFSIRQGRVVNITTNMIGLGDLLFLAAVTFYFSVINFIFFYISSLLLTLLIWKLWTLKNKSIVHVPLAGLQALIFIIFATADWLMPQFSLTDDQWLLNLIYFS